MDILKKKTDRGVMKFTSSFDFDRKLCKYDIAGSAAHAKMLAKCGIIPKAQAARIVKGLAVICREFESGKTGPGKFEDIHMAVEAKLFKKIGKAALALHTARSRNDQVALDLRMYLRDSVKDIIALAGDLQSAVIKMAEKNIGAVMPGYTHMQHGQPVLFSHHIMAYFWMLERDCGRLADCLKRINVMPLGSGPLAGTSLPIDREYVAGLLGFDGITRNSMDSVSDRDFAIEALAHFSLLMVHLSRLGEELVLWSNPEFGFIEINGSFCTGSSIMPQKKNPDVPELVRGKAGRVIGSLNSLLVTMKGLPLSYNRDMQEDKESVFDSVDTVKECLAICAGLIPGISLNREKMRAAADDGFSSATEAADYLVKKGVPFREGYYAAAEMASYCLEKKKRLDNLSLKEFRKFSKAFSGDIYGVLKLDSVVNCKKSAGGTARVRVLEQIKLAKKMLIPRNPVRTTTGLRPRA